MIYSLELSTALLLVGLLLILGHGFALARPAATREFLRGLPRSKSLGMVLLFVAAAWSWLLIKNIDLGEFSNWRRTILIFIPIAAFLSWRYVEEFLAARALGMLVLLAAEPLLESAFLRPEMSRLFLVTLVYVWVGFALFWVGMPYTLRDQIAWVSKSDGRWRAAALAGIAYGVVLLVSIAAVNRGG
jgi:hypothetical protein